MKDLKELLEGHPKVSKSGTKACLIARLLALEFPTVRNVHLAGKSK